MISFHSLEDRIVKQFIARHSKAPPANRRMPVEVAFAPVLRAIGRRRRHDDETSANPRARSAVLRVAEKLGIGNEEGANASEGVSDTAQLATGRGDRREAMAPGEPVLRRFRLPRTRFPAGEADCERRACC